MSPSTPTAMRALRVRDRSLTIAVDEIPVPSPGTGDVLVRVHGAGYTPGEVEWPSTFVDRSGHDRLPAVLSHEVSGDVESLGFGASGFAPGEAVYGLTDWYRDGAAGEYIAVEARNLARRPASIDHVQAAALSLAGSTAWQALFDHGGLEAGQDVAVLGAAGGVGRFAVQLASAGGARVTGTARTDDRDAVTRLGADVFIDVGDLEWPPDAMFDLVVDTVGHEARADVWSRIGDGGHLVSVVDDPAGDEAARSDVRARYFVVEPDRGILGELARRVDAGELDVGEVTRLDLDAGVEAVDGKEHGRVRGKVVFDIERAAAGA